MARQWARSATTPTARFSVPLSLPEIVHTFCVALGVVTGGALMGALGATASRLKSWAMVAALGVTFESIRYLETGFLHGQLRTVARQCAYIMTAFLGAHLGYLLLRR